MTLLTGTEQRQPVRTSPDAGAASAIVSSPAAAIMTVPTVARSRRGRVDSPQHFAPGAEALGSTPRDAHSQHPLDSSVTSQSDDGTSHGARPILLDYDPSDGHGAHGVVQSSQHLSTGVDGPSTTARGAHSQPRLDTAAASQADAGSSNSLIPSADVIFNRPSGDAEIRPDNWAILEDVLLMNKWLERDNWKFKYGGRASCIICPERKPGDAIPDGRFDWQHGCNYTLVVRKSGIETYRIHARLRQINWHAAFHSGPQPLPSTSTSPDDPRVFVKTLALFAANRQRGASMRGSQRSSLLMAYLGNDDFLLNGPLGQQVKHEHSTLFMRHLADVALEEKLSVMRQRPAYGITADELTDSGGTAMTVRGVFLNREKDGYIFTDDVLLGIVKLGPDRSARHLLLEIFILLDRHGLRIVLMLFVATDGASVFVGHLRGMVTIMARHLLMVILQWCASHRLALFNKKAQPREVVATLSATHVLSTCFIYSSAMESRLQSHMRTAIQSPTPHKILHPTDVKFKSIAASVTSVVSNLPGLRLVMDDVEADPSQFSKQAIAFTNAFKETISERLALLRLLITEDWMVRVATTFNMFESGIVLFSVVDREISRLRNAFIYVRDNVTADLNSLPSWFKRTRAAYANMTDNIERAADDDDVDEVHLQAILKYKTDRTKATRRARLQQMGKCQGRRRFFQRGGGQFPNVRIVRPNGGGASKNAGKKLITYALLISSIFNKLNPVVKYSFLSSTFGHS